LRAENQISSFKILLAASWTLILGATAPLALTR